MVYIESLISVFNAFTTVVFQTLYSSDVLRFLSNFTFSFPIGEISIEGTLLLELI